MIRLAKWRLIALSVALMGTLLLDTSNEAQAAAADDVEAAIRAAVEAANAADVDRYIASFTDEGLFQGGLRFGPGFSSREEAAALAPGFLGMVQLEITDLEVQFVAGSTATADVHLRYGILIERSLRDMRLIDGRWLLHTQRIISPEVPQGVTTVPVVLDGCESRYDPSLIRGGNVAFQVHTSGTQLQQVILIRFQSDLSLAQLLQSPGPPPGVEQLFFTIIEPGRLLNLVLAAPLSPGRYGLVCFVPVQGGPPVVRSGSEFTVGAATTTILPPATGDGGLRAERE